MQRMPRPYLAALAAGVTALVFKLIYASISSVVIHGFVAQKVAGNYGARMPALWLLTIVIFPAPAAVAVWVGRLYEAVFAQRLLAVVLVGLAGALANQIANAISEMVTLHGRLAYFGMWQMYAMIFLVTAMGYAFATGVLAAVVALWKARLSMPPAPPPPSPESPSATTPSS